MSQEVIKALKDKNLEYESLLKEMIASAKGIGKIEAGPSIENEVLFYRVDIGGKAMFLPSAIKDFLEKGDEVVISDSFIARKLPKALITKQDPPKMKIIGWNEVGGLKSQVERIRKQIEGPMINAKLCKEFGIEPLKGALLYGPPGCGKTLIARVIASTILGEDAREDAFIYIKGPEILNMYVGATEEKIRNIFSSCRKYTQTIGKRAVIFIDEAEALLSKRGSGISSAINSTIVPQFLSEMDGFDEHSPFVLLSTNLPNSLDSAIIREGRIDSKIEIKRPTLEDSVEIFQIHLKKMKISDKISTLSSLGAEKLFEKKIKVSGAMIKTICNLAAQEALLRYSSSSKKEKGIIEKDLFQAIEIVTSNQVL